MIYISGPISGDRSYKIKFKAAQEQLEARGYSVVNPAELDRVIPAHQMSQEEILTTCLNLLRQCDAIVLLPGWEKSLGCQRERGYAEGSDLIVLRLEDFLET